MKSVAILICMILPFAAMAQNQNFTLSAPADIVDTGFLKYLLPRFSHKHGVRVVQVDTDGDVVIGGDIQEGGLPVFMGLGEVWFITQSAATGPALFTDWLLSDIGKRTIESFKPDGTSLFSSQIVAEVPMPEISFDGDPVMGEVLSLKHCGRCHVINDSNKMKGIGQTPSFALMRTFDDWQNRFSTFYVLNPHPSFSQVKDITTPFRAHLPPAIVPIEITQDELEAIVAYVATIAPADLGAPLHSQ